MSLINAVKNIARRVYSNDLKVGDLGSLKTTDKTSIVNAINALAADTVAKAGVSEVRAQQIAAAELAKITGGASAAMDTLAEIEAAFNGKDSQITTLLQEIAKVKQANTDLQAEVNELKTYVGLSEKATLEVEVTRLLDTGA